MRVANLYNNQTHPTISFEFFPPRDEKAEIGFYKVIDELSGLRPDYMSMTFGAGGSTREGSYQAVKKMIQEKKVPTVAYLAAFGLGPDEITEVLDRYKEVGIETIFAIRGDEPRNSEFKPHPNSFSYASDLIKFISAHYDFDLGCSCYPEGHVQAESLEKDIEYLKLKQDNGAQYAVAQYFYDNAFFYSYVNKCRTAGVTIPIIPGIMPIYTVKMTRNLCKLCGSSIPAGLEEKLNAFGEKPDPKKVMALGVEVAVEQCIDLLKNDVKALHFYTMDRSESIKQILNRLKEKGAL